MTVLVPITLLLFMWLPPRRAVITAFMAGWLFLPSATFQLPGIPDYSKMMATCTGILLAAIVFDIETLLAYRPRWFDLPMLLWCLCPFCTNAAEEIDVYDSFSWSVHQFITWGLPYFIGRCYFKDAESVRELAIGFVISGIVYIPICLFEIKMSPVLSKWLYGFDSGFSGRRLGGWRPQGLLASGLTLGMWMTTASLLAIWMRFTGSLPTIGRHKARPLVAALVITTVLCKSTGALALLMMGLGCLFAIRYVRKSAVIFLLCLPAIAYPIIRAGGTWDGSQAVALAKSIVGPERAQSLQFRLKNENLLSKRALMRPWWGWGRFGKARVKNEFGKDISTTDGLWIIVLGTSGIVGLVLLTSIYLVPVIWFWWRTRAPDWFDPSFSPIAGFAVVLTLYSIDNILNAMLNPVIPVCMGAVLCASLKRTAVVETVAAAKTDAAPLRTRAKNRTLWPPAHPARDESPLAAERERPSEKSRRRPGGPHWRH